MGEGARARDASGVRTTSEGGTGGGDEFDVSEGGVYEIMPDHDAWVTGDGPYQALEFQSQTAATYAKPSD